MGRRNKTHLCGPQDASVQVSKWGALSGICSLLLLYYCFRKDGFLRHHHHPNGLTETELTALYRTEKENKFLEITRTAGDIRSINIVPVGFSNRKSSGFYELSKRCIDQAVEEYEAMPNVTKEHSTFLFHSFDMMRDGDDTTHSSLFDAVTHLATTRASSISHLQVYNEILSTSHLDLISAALKVRQFIEAIVYVRLSLEASTDDSSNKQRKNPYNGKLRNKIQGSKLQMNLFVADVHVALYQSVLMWVLALAPSLDDFVVYSVEVKCDHSLLYIHNNGHFKQHAHTTFIHSYTHTCHKLP
jgi:hypothetical protein